VTATDNAIEATAVEAAFDFEIFFRLQYDRLAGFLGRVVRDRARAEEIAAEAFWKLWRQPAMVHNSHPAAWLYRTAIRMALDDLRRETRRLRREALHPPHHAVPTPEETHSFEQERSRVRLVLASLETRQSELLLLRGNGLSYAEVAAALDLNPASVGTLLSRAQLAFRKHYVTQFGEPKNER
jgi:RNA polymerase sigma-70 factor (ECF subfamily)